MAQILKFILLASWLAGIPDRSNFFIWATFIFGPLDLDILTWHLTGIANLQVFSPIRPLFWNLQLFSLIRPVFWPLYTYSENVIKTTAYCRVKTLSFLHGSNKKTFSKWLGAPTRKKQPNLTWF